jgi:hypothetical protein
MTTIVRPRAETRAGLFLAWSFTVLAILAIGLVVVTAPMPQLTDAATTGLAAPSTAKAPALPTGAATPVDGKIGTVAGLGA